MSSSVTNAMFASSSGSYFKPGLPGSPNYRGAKDYPSSIYPGYPGSQGYVWEPSSLGYPFLESDNIIDPVAQFPHKINQTSQGLVDSYTTHSSVLLGECSVPVFFIDSERQIERCTTQWANKIFLWIILINSLFATVFFKQITLKYCILFVLFHMILYFIITKVSVKQRILEWNTSRYFKQYMKSDPDFSRFDTPVRQFDLLSKWSSEQPVNQNKITYCILVLSLVFVWVPLLYKL